MSGGFLVLLSPIEDNHCSPDIWLIRGIDNEPRRKKFELHFNVTKTQVVRKQPEDWNLEDIRRILQKRWDITVLPEGVKVLY